MKPSCHWGVNLLTSVSRRMHPPRAGQAPREGVGRSKRIRGLGWGSPEPGGFAPTVGWRREQCACVCRTSVSSGFRAGWGQASGQRGAQGRGLRAWPMGGTQPVRRCTGEGGVGCLCLGTKRHGTINARKPPIRTCPARPGRMLRQTSSAAPVQPAPARSAAVPRTCSGLARGCSPWWCHPGLQVPKPPAHSCPRVTTALSCDGH